MSIAAKETAASNDSFTLPTTSNSTANYDAEEAMHVTSTSIATGTAPPAADPSSSSSSSASASAVPGGEGAGGGGGEVTFARKLSMSETAQLSAGGWDAPYPLSLIMEWPFRIKDPKNGNYVQEATGWAMDGGARGPFNQIGSLVGSAILQLAALDAGCSSPATCDETVAAGLKPSSLLTLISTVVGLLAAILMPVAGAIVDHTRHRKLVGIVTGLLLVIVTGMQIGISMEPNNWLYMMILDGIQSFSLLVHATAVFAYLPDITLDHSSLPVYTAHFNIRQFLAQMTVGGLVILFSQLRLTRDPALADDRVQASVYTARDGAAIAFTYGCVFFGYAWTFLFRKRPALSHVPEGSNLIDTGFKQVYRTGKKIGKEYRALRWFMFSLLWSPEAGAGVIQSIAITYFVVVMGFDSLDIAKAALVVMATNVVGSFFSRWVCTKMNPLNSYRVSLFLFAITFVIGAIYMDRPERRASVWGFAAALGFFMGWVYPSQRIMFVTLIPKGQETEMMGLFFFMGQILGWLMPLLFTTMNEKDVDMRWGLGLVAFFSFFAVLCTFPMGNYEAAVELAARDSEAKFNAVLEAASHHENYSSGALTRRKHHDANGYSSPSNKSDDKKNDDVSSKPAEEYLEA